jgi:predicted 3-demethylubiquinone-9 3-methyltransferase (glyoxalase superfamily)
MKEHIDMTPKNTICLWFDKDALDAGGDEAKRAFEAMMTMRKIDVATIEAARRG